MDLMEYKNLDLARKDMSHKLIFESNKKKRWNSAFQWKKGMSEKNQGLHHRGGRRWK